MNNLDTKLFELFSRQWDEELSDEQENNLDSAAANLVEQYGWDKVFNALMVYLQNHCVSPESAINAAHVLWGYGWYEKHIPEPYEFLGFFYNAINFDVAKYDNDSDILYSMAITILPAQGHDAADIVKNPYYAPEEDPLIIAAAERWKNKL